MKELDDRLNSLQRTLNASAGLPATVPTEQPRDATAVQLPFWPEPKRGAPNAILRSALFAGIKSGKREMIGVKTRPEKPVQTVTLASQEGITIKFAGQQLNQYDADVFFEALHRARFHPLETECIFSGYSFLKSIGRPTSEDAYEDLDDSLTRLRDGRVEAYWTMHGEPMKYVGSLVPEYVRGDKATDKLFRVKFALLLKNLFAPACWTQLEWEERMTLKGQPLAQWLHSYYSTHADPLPVTAKFLHDKSGSKRPTVRNFRTDLKAALKTIETILGWQCEHNTKTDLVTVVRTPSAAQTRHLERSKDRKKRAAVTKQLQRQQEAREAERRLQQRKPQPDGMVSVSSILPGLFLDPSRRRR